MISNNILPFFKFKPILRQAIWGGEKIAQIRSMPIIEPIAESWELSSVEGNISVVASEQDNGMTLNELIQKHREQLVGKECYNIFNDKFPLLLKFIDACDDLSIQVHPDNPTAQRLEGKQGKTEMWYVVNCDNDAELIGGFQQPTTPNQYSEAILKGSIMELLNRYKIKNGDAMFMPAGMIHAIRNGCLIAEIQQSSDVTYRIWDYNRIDKDGKYRELHTSKAIQAIDFSSSLTPKIGYTPTKNQATSIVECEYFKVTILDMDQIIVRDYTKTDSFVVLMCVEGACNILDSNNNNGNIDFCQTILLSAQTKVVRFSPKVNCKLLEITL